MVIYLVKEHGTGYVMGKYKTYLRARKAMDRLDNQYGCYHYYVEVVK